MICFAFQAALADQEKIPIGEVFKGIIPFLIGDIVCLIILLVFPGFVLLLPNLMTR
jgi:TRAP-type mannitol/chloroaromatic compound transport system permease large subunit